MQRTGQESNSFGSLQNGIKQPARWNYKQEDAFALRLACTSSLTLTLILFYKDLLLVNTNFFQNLPAALALRINLIDTLLPISALALRWQYPIHFELVCHNDLALVWHATVPSVDAVRPQRRSQTVTIMLAQLIRVAILFVALQQEIIQTDSLQSQFAPFLLTLSESWTFMSSATR